MEEAHQTAPFPIVMPKVLPSGARLLKCLVEPEYPPQWVGITWAIDPGHSYTLGLRQGPAVARDAERFRGDEIVEEDLRLLIEESGPESHRSRTLLMQLGDACFELYSDLPRDTLVAVARSLKQSA
jgi:hypothetical protein